MLTEAAVTRLLAVMRDGRRVLVVCENYTAIREILPAFASRTADGEVVRYANGEQEISSRNDDGRIQFATVRSRDAVRGMSVDLAVLDTLDHRVRQTVEPAVAARRGQIVMAWDLR